MRDYKYEKELLKERARNKAHRANKKGKPKNIWGQTCEYMCMLSDRPKSETEEEKNIRLLERKMHRLNTYK